MTKKFKRAISLILAFAMVMALGSFPVSADDDTYSIKVYDTASGHTYNAYQIFSGDYSEGVLSNIDWGSGVTTDTTNANYVSAEEAAEYIAEHFTGSTTDTTSYAGDEIIAYLNSIGVTLNDSNATTLSYENSTEGSEYYTASGFASGYYLVIDESDTVTDGDSYTSYLLTVLGDDAKLSVKKSEVEVTKEVEEINDSTDDAATYGDTADYDIGDKINFKLTGTLPSNYDDYETYYYVFHDVQSDALDFDSDSVVVTIDGIVVDNGYTVLVRANSNTMNDEDCTFEVVFDNLNECYDENNDLITVTANSKIVVTYTSTLNEKAVIGSTGNDNKVTLEYSNDSTNDGDGSTGTTPEDIVTVFTFELLINKVTENDAYDPDDPNSEEYIALAGAGFTLYKYDADSDEYVQVGNEVTDVSSFVFTGLDAGLYKIVETKTPSGYNTIDDIYFTVTATYTEDTDDNSYKVESLEVTVTDKDGNELTSTDTTFTVNTDATGTTIENTDDDGISTTSGSSSITTDIVNNEGSTLPETGGMGTKLFYTLGGILVVGAGILLIVKRRMRNA